MSKDLFGNEIPRDVEETLYGLGEQVKDILLDTDNPAIMCAIVSAVVDAWANEYGYDAINLAKKILMSMLLVNEMEEKEDEEE